MLKWRHVVHPIRSAKALYLMVFHPARRQSNSAHGEPLESLPNVPDLFHMYRVLSQDPHLKRMPGGWLYRDKFYPDYLTVGGAAHAIFPEARKYCRGAGIDVGAGLWPLPGAI